MVLHPMIHGCFESDECDCLSLHAPWSYDHISDSTGLASHALLRSGTVTSSFPAKCAGIQIIVCRKRGINKSQSYHFLALKGGVTAACTEALFSPSIIPWCCVTTIIYWRQRTEPWRFIAHVPNSSIDDYWLAIPVTRHITNFNVRHPCRYFTQTVSPSLYWAGGIMSIPFTWILYECSRLARRGESVILRWAVIPIYGLHNRAALPHSNLFYCLMTLLFNTIFR